MMIINPYIFAAGGGIAYLASVGKSPASTTTATTDAIDTTGADCIVVATARNQPNAATLTDSQGNTWTKLTDYAIGGDDVMAIYYCLNPTTNAAHTFTFSGSSSYPALIAAAFSGVTAFASENGSTGSTPLSTGSVTPPGSGCLFVSGISKHGSQAMSIDSGFTVAQDITQATGYGIAFAYKIQGAAAAENPAWSFTSGTCAAAIAVFEP